MMLAVAGERGFEPQITNKIIYTSSNISVISVGST